MVAEHLQFLYSECMNMVQSERKKDLSNMYDLLRSVQNAIVVLVDTVLDHIKTQGLAVSFHIITVHFQLLICVKKRMISAKETVPFYAVKLRSSSNAPLVVSCESND